MEQTSEQSIQNPFYIRVILEVLEANNKKKLSKEVLENASDC